MKWSLPGRWKTIATGWRSGWNGNRKWNSTPVPAPMRSLWWRQAGWNRLFAPGPGFTGVRLSCRAKALPDPEEGYPIPFADSTLLLPESFPKGDRIAAQEVQVGYGVQRCYTAAFPAVPQTVLIPGGHCIHTILRINDDFSISTEQMEPVRKMAEREGLVFSGQPLTHRIVSLYRETETFRYDDAWFPVEKKA